MTVEISPECLLCGQCVHGTETLIFVAQLLASQNRKGMSTREAARLREQLGIRQKGLCIGRCRSGDLEQVFSRWNRSVRERHLSRMADGQNNYLVI